MRLGILHRTLYRYSAPVYYSIQQLRLTPRTEPHQRTLRWRLDAPAPLTPFTDAYGNLTHTLTLAGAHGDVTIEARGEVEVDALADGRLPEAPGGLPPQSYLATTPLTEPDGAVVEFAHAHLKRPDAHGLLEFAHAVCGAVSYETGTTEVTSTAREALALGRGVCQDHAHLYVAACRVRGLPARYVSGYVHPGDAPHAASHAWADVWVDDAWVSIDITHRSFASEHLCRLAVGRDYAGAGPVRGVRVGGGDESMDVRVNIRPFPFAAAVHGDKARQ